MKQLTLIAAVALLLAATAASAQRVRLDDSQSPVDSLHVDLAMDDAALEQAVRALATATAEMPPATGRVSGVEVRLDTRDYVGQSARIFLTMPDLAGGGTDLELRWEAGGRFLSGSVRPGQSTLVFEGPVEQPLTSGTFNFVLLIGDRAASLQNRMEVSYELEVLP